jgi:hypothetical protein
MISAAKWRFWNRRGRQGPIGSPYQMNGSAFVTLPSAKLQECEFRRPGPPKSSEWQSAALKRLASAVRFRPWPPQIQQLTSTTEPDSVPFCSKKNIPARTGSAQNRPEQMQGHHEIAETHELQ